MRALFTVYPAHGHFRPVAPIAAALMRRGHEVAFVTSTRFLPEIERYGFRAFPSGIDFDHPQALQTLENRRLEVQKRELSRMLGHFGDDQKQNLDPVDEELCWALGALFAGVMARRMVPDLEAVARDWRADVLVSDATELASPIVAERLHRPAVTVSLGVYLDSARLWECAGCELAALRCAVGLPEEPRLEESRQMELVLGPPSFQDPEHRPPRLSFIRPAYFGPEVGAGAPSWLRNLPKRSTVYLTLGTYFNSTPGLLEALAMELAEEQVNLLVTTGPNWHLAELGELPNNVRCEQFIAHSQILPHCDAVVSHGGFGTTMDALTVGLPMVLIPIAADQPLLASRCAALGAAEVVRLRELSLGTARQALRRVMDQPTYRKGAETLAEELRVLPDVEEAARLIESAF